MKFLLKKTIKLSPFCIDTQPLETFVGQDSWEAFATYWKLWPGPPRPRPQSRPVSYEWNQHNQQATLGNFCHTRGKKKWRVSSLFWASGARPKAEWSLWTRSACSISRPKEGTLTIFLFSCISALLEEKTWPNVSIAVSLMYFNVYKEQIHLKTFHNKCIDHCAEIRAKLSCIANDFNPIV